MELEEKDMLEVNTFSNEIHDIIEAVPSWPIRYGIIYFSFFVLLFFFFLHLISYPDLIQCRVTIISETPSVKILTKRGGALQLFKKEKVQVSKGEELALILNTSKYEHLKLLEIEIPSYRELIQKGALDQLTATVKKNLVLGDLQLEYNAFMEALNTYVNFMKLNLTDTKNLTYDNQIRTYRKLGEQVRVQLELKEKEVALLTTRYEQNKILVRDKIISAVDFENFEIQFLEKQQSLEILRNNLINNELLIQQMNERKQEVLINENKTMYEVSSALDLTLNRLESRILNWKEQYLLIAPVSGELNYLGFFDDNQFVEQGASLFSISSFKGSAYAKGLIPLEGSGKVMPKQKALISLDNYPDYEFGHINASVDKIGSIPENGFYTITFHLPEGLSTNLTKEISFSPELQGAVEIITNDHTVLDRIFGQLSQIFRH